MFLPPDGLGPYAATDKNPVATVERVDNGFMIELHHTDVRMLALPGAAGWTRHRLDPQLQFHDVLAHPRPTLLA